MTRLRDRMREDLELRGSSAATIELYLRCARIFVEYFGMPPAKLGAAEVRHFLLHLIHDAKASPSTVNVYGGAIRFLYNVTLKRPEVVADVVYMKTPMRLPRVLSGTDVARRWRSSRPCGSGSWRWSLTVQVCVSARSCVWRPGTSTPSGWSSTSARPSEAANGT